MVHEEEIAVHRLDILLTAGETAKAVFDLSCGKFRNLKLNTYFRPINVPIEWTRLAYNSKVSPKSTYILWLVVQNYLPTNSRLYLI